MRRILLMRPNHTNDKVDHYVSFPSGLAYIAGVLKAEGYAVKVRDLTLENVDYDQLREDVRAYDPDLIGLTALSHAYPSTKRLTRFLKETLDRPIVLGGHLSTQNHATVLANTDVDVCVLGEGELTIIDLLNNFDNLEAIKGIAYMKDGEVRLNPARELIQDLDTIPMPAYELFDMDKYTRMMRNVYMSLKKLPRRREHRKIAMETGRGCPFSCNYCSKMYRSIRKRSVGHILKEIKYLRDNFDIDIFRFQDELFFFNKDYVREFCDKIVDLNVGWSGNARIDTVDEEMIRLIRDHNCLSVSFGVESGSEKILKNMNKKITPQQIEKTLTLCLKLGMPISINLILGYPGEDRQSVEKTVALLAKVGYPGAKFHYITPYPGSTLYEDCREKGLIPDEDEYLHSLGDGTGPYKFRFNFTEFTDQELADLLPEVARRVLRNYIKYLIKHPNRLVEYALHKDIMNPFYMLYNKYFHPTNYDKAAKKLARA